MRTRLMWFLSGIVLLTLVAAYIDLPGTSSFLSLNPKVVLGLDLKGGVRILYCTSPGEKFTASAMSAARDVMERRATSGLAVTAPQISVVNGNCIDAEIPGSRNAAHVIRTLGSTGLLVLGDTGINSTSHPSNPLYNGEKVNLTTTGVANMNATPPVVKVIVPGTDVSQNSATQTADTTGAPVVNYTLNSAGSNAWCSYTTNNDKFFSPVILDNRVVVDPVIQGSICNGQTQVTGLSSNEASGLVIDLNYGSIPVQLHLSSSEQVSATLGPEYVHKAVLAGIVGLILVALFMLFYYRLPGAIADLALLIYALVVFAIFKIVPVTLTLEGAAGFILSIGMAVDANVLIFERVKEELRAGKTLGAAIESGFSRAWTSIRDSNISTMITTAILFWFGQHFGTSIITGFAETLFIGVAVSMFTAILVSRTFLRLLVASGRGRSLALFGLNDTSNREPALGASVV